MIYIFLGLVFYTSLLLIGTFASRMANTNLVSAIVSLFSAIIPTLVAIPLLNKATIENQRIGVMAAIIAGLIVGLFTLVLNKSLAVNKVGIVIPIIFGGSIFLSTILSYFIFKEKVSLMHGIGLGFLGIGILIITYVKFVEK
ncbi:MAG: hypothetical protein HY344_00460 [Candidatus Levybacteria bacterium]|nr:hypothetical protein [Candidatus Levybacteria bacterium]